MTVSAATSFSGGLFDTGWLRNGPPAPAGPIDVLIGLDLLGVVQVVTDRTGIYYLPEDPQRNQAYKLFDVDTPFGVTTVALYRKLDFMPAWLEEGIRANWRFLLEKLPRIKVARRKV